MAFFPLSSLAAVNAQDRESSPGDVLDRLIRAEFKLARPTDGDPDDRMAELIAALSNQDAEKMWPVLIQLRPHLSD